MNDLRALEGLSIAELRLFVRAVALNSFSAAAREGMVSQPAVSRLVATMEERLGAPLFVRTTRRTSATVLGERVAAALQPVVDVFASVDVQPETEGLTGQLRVAAPGSFGRAFVAPAVTQFLAEHPGVDIDLQLSDRRADLVRERIDVAIRLGPLPDGARVRTLGVSAQAIVCAPSLAPLHPLRSLQELAHRPALLLASGAAAIRAAGLKPSALRARMTADDIDVLYAAAVAGLGVTLLPLWRTQRALDDGLLVRLLPGVPLPKAPIRAVFPNLRRPTRLARAFVDVVAGALPPQLRGLPANATER